MNNSGTYINSLPSIHHSEFMKQFLPVFECLLSGGIADGADIAPAGIGDVLDRVHDYFDPKRTPPEFLDWLAGWVALDLKEGEYWNDDDYRMEGEQRADTLLPLSSDRNTRNRDLIGRIVKLYGIRGTLEGLLEYLDIYVGKENITINEYLEPMQLGNRSVIGKDTLIGNGRPYYFHVRLVLPERDREKMKKKEDSHNEYHRPGKTGPHVL